MNPKTIVLLSCLLWLGACSNPGSPLPTRVPTAVPIIPHPPSNAPISTEMEPDAADAPRSDSAEIDALLQEIDQEVCQEVFETQTELDALLNEGKDVTELATAVAELADELEACESLVTPAPNN